MSQRLAFVFASLKTFSAATGRQAAPHAAFSQRKLFGLGKS